MPGFPPPNSNRASQRQGPAAPALVSITELNLQSTGSDRRSEGSGPRAVCHSFPFVLISSLPTTTQPSQVVLVEKNLPAKAGDVKDVGSTPGSGRSLGEGNGNPLRYSCLETPWTEGLVGLSPWRCKSRTWLKQLHTHCILTTVQSYSPFIDEETEVRGWIALLRSLIKRSATDFKKIFNKKKKKRNGVWDLNPGLPSASPALPEKPRGYPWKLSTAGHTTTASQIPSSPNIRGLIRCERPC